MRPRKLILENIGPFIGRTTVDFSELGDIFLISGKTGSGKTTIFDSICYALYGIMPGGRRNQTRRLRSDFAGDEDACSVALEFELGSQAYLVERTPPRQRKKARGEGWIEDPESTVLFEYVQGRLEQRSGKKGDADERIKKLIGLSFDEFSKIVLLPQGEFAEFLKQNTSDRREVLRKLFPVDHAVRTREIAAERSKALSARLIEAERSLAEAAARFDAAESEAVFAQARERLAAAEEDMRKLEAERDLLAEELRTAETLKETRESLRLASEAESRLDEGEAAIKEKERKLAASRTAKPLAPVFARAGELEASAEKAARSAEEAAAGRKTCADTISGIKKREAEIEGAVREAAELRGKRGPLAEAARDEKELEALKAQSRETAQLEAQARTEKETADAAARERAEEVSRLREKAESADGCDAAWEAAREAMERARAVKPFAERAERLLQDRRDAEEAAERLSAEIAVRQAEEPILKAEIEEIERLLRVAELSSSAAVMASSLRAGTPCPVCGSLEHPAPAQAAGGTFDLSARRDVRRRNAEDAAKTLAAKQAEAAASHARIKRLNAELEEVYASSGVPGGALPSAAEAAARLAALSDAANAALAPRTEARKARDRLGILYRDTEKHAELVKRLEGTLSLFAARRSGIDAAAAEKEKRRTQALMAFGEDIDSASAALALIDARIAGLETRAAAWKEEREQAIRALAGAEAAEKAAKAAADEAAAAAAAERRKCDDLLALSPFPNESVLRVSVLDSAEEARLEREIPEWKEARSQARTRREELEKALAKIEADRLRSKGSLPLDAEAAALALERNVAARAQATERRDAAKAALNAFERNKAAYEEAASRRRVLAEESALLKALADDLSGNNPQKRSFDAWLLGAYLSEVAAYATKRLERMSEGRYRLVLDDEREGGRGQLGLDLAVFDSYTGKERPCATLSGGESFMASISLALGLADSIQARSGGVRLDAVFIDEGFGSLDDASLDKALGILDEIRDHRMVGLISHVGEMKNRIPNRLEIVKTSTGSRFSAQCGA